jgi:hypothetical protein
LRAVVLLLLLLLLLLLSRRCSCLFWMPVGAGSLSRIWIEFVGAFRTMPIARRHSVEHNRQAVHVPPSIACVAQQHLPVRSM